MIKDIKQKEIIYFAITILASLIFITLDKLNLLDWFKRSAEKVINPLKIAERQVYKKISLINADPEATILREKANFLEKENAELKVKMNELILENNSQRKLLGAPLPPSWKFIPAKVTGVANGIMTINQGSDSGVKNGQVIILETSLVGRIDKVTAGQAKVILPINRLSEIKADILPARAKGVVKSEVNQPLVLDQVLQEVNLNPDQIIVTSGEDGLFPPNLVIGKIVSVEKKETAVYQQATLKPILNYQDLDIVFVINSFP